VVALKAVRRKSEDEEGFRISTKMVSPRELVGNSEWKEYCREEKDRVERGPKWVSGSRRKGKNSERRTGNDMLDEAGMRVLA
jgi:hypothetical protein